MSFLFKNRIVIKTAAFILTAASFIQIFFAFPFLSEENDIDISQIKSSSALITNLDTGTVLFSRNEEEQVFCGFLPQVIGCVLLLELSTDLNTEVTISKEVISQTPQISSANLKAGDVISLSDLITAVMMCGSQESCLAIAEYVSQDTDKFLELINNKVSELGCTGTKINNVHGYFKPYAVITTVNDIAKVLKLSLIHI